MLYLLLSRVTQEKGKRKGKDQGKEREREGDDYEWGNE